MGTQAIMLVEDNEDDVFFMRRAFKEAGIQNPVVVTTDGEAAIDYLAGKDPYSDREKHPLPGLILLDLKLPRKNGHEVLSWIRERPAFSTTVVIVLTSSKHIRDVDTAARLGANSFLVKPSDVGGLSELVKLCRLYWLEQDQIAQRAGLLEDNPR